MSFNPGNRQQVKKIRKFSQRKSLTGNGTKFEND